MFRFWTDAENLAIQEHYGKISPKAMKDFWTYGFSGSRAAVFTEIVNSLSLPLLQRKWGRLLTIAG